MTWLLLLTVALLAFSNGANDNFKGVASLYGSRTVSYRVALAWATVTTLAGSVGSLFLAQTLLKRFSGKGLVPDTLVGSEAFLLAIALGAGLTVLLATRCGFPISTTHGLLGAMVGAGLVANQGEVALSLLSRQFVLPLLASPLAAVLLGGGLYFAFHQVRVRFGITKETCVCVGTEPRCAPQLQSATFAAQAAPAVSLAVASEAHCAEHYTGAMLGVNCQSLMDAAHFASAGVVSFARGLNDTPKIAALLLVVETLDARGGMIVVALAMALGGLLNARRVAETMSHKITAMNHGQGFAANLATGLLVIGASCGGMPVSTTHVSVGALFGIGATTHQADVRVVGQIALSWLLTLPCAAILSGLAYGMLVGW